MAMVPQLDNEPRNSFGYQEVQQHPLSADNGTNRNSWHNVVSTATVDTMQYSLIKKSQPTRQDSNVNYGQTPQQGMSRQSSVSQLSYGVPMESYSKAQTMVAEGSGRLPNLMKPASGFHSYNPYPAGSVISQPLAPVAPPREVKIKTPSVSNKSRQSNSTGSSSHKGSITIKPKSNKLQSLCAFLSKPTVRMCTALCCFLFLALIIIAIVLAVVIPNYQTSYQFSWAAPENLRGGNSQPSQIKLQLDEANNQARFDLTGHIPFKSNFITVYDFKTKKAIVYDESLKNGTKNLACFVYSFDDTNFKALDDIRKAARDTSLTKAQSTGWDERWNFIPSPLDNAQQLTYINPGIAQCNGAKIIELKQTGSNQKSLKCTDCYDFCVPMYNSENDLIKSTSMLNIAYRGCFYMFVPEWQTYAQGYNMGGYNNRLQQQPQQQMQQQQRGFGQPQQGFNGNSYQQPQFNGHQQNYPPQQQQFGNQNNNQMRFQAQPTQAGNPFSQQAYGNGAIPLNNGGNQGQPQFINGQQVTDTKWIPVGGASNLANQLGNTSANVWNSVQNKATDTLNTLQGVQESVGRNIQNVGQNINGPIGEGIDRFGNNIRTGISDTRSSINSGLDSAGQAITNFGQQAGQTFQNAGNQINQGLTNVANQGASIHDQIRSQFNQLSSSGDNTNTQGVGPTYNTQGNNQQFAQNVNANTNPNPNYQAQQNTDSVHFLVRERLNQAPSMGSGPQQGNTLSNPQVDMYGQLINPNLNSPNQNQQPSQLSPGMAQYSQNSLRSAY
uniref:F5/8 type C domain-containing protein n=1 Tax=Rhabditophanes sp. KR3021 TaxID=114890 RepID=A0AC35TRC6_9BILA